MTSASLQFLEYAFAVVLLFNLSTHATWRRLVLLASSVYFIALCSPGQSLVPFAAFVLFGYAGLRLLQAGWTRAFAPLLIGTLISFIWLKKYGFVPNETFLHFPYFVIGLSYVLFRVLHLMIDARNEALPANIGIVSYLNYTLNFTTLVSGPIQRYQQFAKTYFVSAQPRLSVIPAGLALERIIRGFFKVNVLGLIFSMIHSWGINASPGDISLAVRFWLGIAAFAAYPLFLYCNFSGYIDVVIGIAQLMHFNLPENFDRPFSADDFIGFWSRWHITLSDWLKQSIYSPLMMFSIRHYPSERLQPFFTVAAFFLTFFLVGIWHGQTSVFVFFGILQGLGVSVNKLYQILMARRLGRQRYKALCKKGLYIAVARGLTFTWFTFTVVWFWSDWQQIANLRALFGESLSLVWGAIFVGSTVILAGWEAARSALLGIKPFGEPLLFSRYVRVAWTTVILVSSIAIVALLNQGAPEIVYKGF